MPELRIVDRQYGRVPGSVDGSVELAPGLFYPTSWIVRGRPDRAVPITVELFIEYEPSAGRYEVRSISVAGQPQWPVTGDMLRSISVAQWLRDTAQPSAHSKLPRGAVREGPYGLMTPEARSRMREAGPVTETLEMVAMIYRVAHAVGDPPTKQVEVGFALPRATADRWVKRARERGFLGEARGQGKAGS